MSYFGFVGAIRFVISEFLKEITLIYDFGGPMPVSNNIAGSGSLPVGSNAAGLNCTMQAPNNSGIGSSSAANASTTNDYQKLIERIHKKKGNIEYYQDQLYAAKRDLTEVEVSKDIAVAQGSLDKWQTDFEQAKAAVKDTDTNLKSELKMYNALKLKLDNGDYSTSMSGKPTVSKRTFSDSMLNDDSNTVTNNKRTSDNR